jgi:hypothetical protein
MPRIDKPKKVMKKKIKKSVRVAKPKTPKKVKSSLKNPVAYFECMKECCQAGIKPKKITEVAHECKSNALTAKKRMSAEKAKDIKKLGTAFNEFKKVLTEHVKKY